MNLEIGLLSQTVICWLEDVLMCTLHCPLGSLVTPAPIANVAFPPTFTNVGYYPFDVFNLTGIVTSYSIFIFIC